MKHREFKVINWSDLDKVQTEVNLLLQADEGWQVLSFGTEHIGAPGFVAALVKVEE